MIKWFLNLFKIDKDIDSKFAHKIQAEFFSDRHNRNWSEEEIVVLMTSELPDSELAIVLRRTENAIVLKRNKIKREGGEI